MAGNTTTVEKDELVDFMADQLAQKPEKLFDLFLKGIEESDEESREKFFSELRERLGEEHRDRAKDAIKQFDAVKEEASPSDRDAIIRAAIEGRTPPQSPKEIRDNKWWLGNPSKSLENGRRRVEAEDSVKSVVVLAETWRKQGGPSPKFWQVARKTAEEMGYEGVEKRIEKTLNTDQLGAGSDFVPQETAAEIIGFLYANSVLRTLGVRSIDITGGSIDFNKVTSTATAYWLGQLEEAQASEPEFGKDSLEAHKMAILVVLSNELMRRTPDGFETLVEDDMQQVARLEEDRVGFFGSGNQAEPEGIYQQTQAANKFVRQNPGAAASVDEMRSDIMQTINAVDTSNVDVGDETAAFVGHPRTKNALAAQVDADNDASFFAEQIASGNLMGYPLATTSQFPTTLDDSNQGTGDETRLLFGVFRQVLIGESLNMQMRRADSGTAPNVQGTDVNLLTQMATAMMLVHETDFLLRHKEAMAWLEGVDYAPDLNW